MLESQQQGYRIKLEQAVELGILNSREFQDRREDLYLAALPVSLQRFSFAAQGFFTEQAALNFAGKLTGTVPSDAANFGTTTGFNKLFPTGALLAVKLANQVVVDLTGDRPATTVSNFSLSLAQPFLRGGGYAVTLEPLTLAERNMVYAIRSYARFRKLFYVAVAAGGGYTNNPYGLQGLSVDLGRGVGNNLTAPSVGYLPLLLQAAVIANQKQNVDSLEQLLRLYEAFREGGQQSDLQVGQVGGALGGQALGDLQAVDAVHPGEVFRDRAGLVALDGADEVPDDIEVCQRIHLRESLLEIALPEVPLTGSMGGADDFGIEGLRHGDQLNVARVAAGRPGCGADPILHGLQPRGQSLDNPR